MPLSLQQIKPVRQAVAYGTPTVAINEVRIDDDPTSYTSAEIDLGNARGINLLLSVLSTGTPTSVQFFLLGSDTSGGTFNTIVAPRVNLLIYGNAETASVNVKNIPVEVVGKRYVKVYAVGIGTTAIAYFTISATVTPLN